MTAHAYIESPPELQPSGRKQKLTMGMQAFTSQIVAWHARNGDSKWFTPKALHSCGRGRIQTRLASLIVRGYLERQRIPGTTGGTQFLFEYRLTAAGIAALAGR